MVMEYHSEYKILKITTVLIIVCLILLSSFQIQIIDNAHATRYISTDNSGRNAVILTNNGFGGKSNLLTCGEVISLLVVNNSLQPYRNYTVKVWNGAEWISCYIIQNTSTSDKYGDLSIQFHVPGFQELHKHPMKDNGFGNEKYHGLWNISLWNSGSNGSQIWNGLNITIAIGNLYQVYLTWEEDDPYKNHFDSLLYNHQESFYVHVRNWTGNLGWQNIYNDEHGIGAWNLSVFSPVGGNPIQFISNIHANNQFITLTTNNSYLPSNPDQFEYMYTVNVSKYNSGSSFHSNITLPIKLNVTASYPSNATWGDTLDINGYVFDGNDTGISGYMIQLYAPTARGVNGGYVTAFSIETNSTGGYSMVIETGPDTGYAAGIWYLGTYNSGAIPPRINESDHPPYISSFIPYHSFTLNTKDDVDISIINTDNIISNFTQTINVSVYNSSWMWSGLNDSYNEYKHMIFQVTGLESWDGNQRYNREDIVPVNAKRTKVDTNEEYAYYEFNWTFNETGNVTLWASWPGNLTDYQGEDSSYSNTYNESVQMLANITGSTSFIVVTPNEMNLEVSDNFLPRVLVSESEENWKNTSQIITLNVYGNSSERKMNATITISGCGLDMIIKEDDTVASNEYLIARSTGQYTLKVQPKIAGTLTITATNKTKGTSVTKDFSIKGLVGSVTTSKGDDISITVGTTETITVTITNGNFAEVHLTYYDLSWSNPNSLNITIGDGTSGAGANGRFTFVPNLGELGNVGFIVVAAKAGLNYYMYEIIKIEPIYDLTIEMISPISTNESFTVGMQVDIMLQLLDDEGNPVIEDMPHVIGKYVDNRHNEHYPLQTITFSQMGPYWVASDVFFWKSGTFIVRGYNASIGMRHEGLHSIKVTQARITYDPPTTTAGIGLKNLTISVSGNDANGNPLPEGTQLYFWCKDSEDAAVGGNSSNTNAVNFKQGYEQISLDADGKGFFILEEVGDNRTIINASIQDNNPSEGNDTFGYFTINYPDFIIDPEVIYVGQPNVVNITAKDVNNQPIEGINLTFYSSISGIIPEQPNPIETDENGTVTFTINPVGIGVLNVTIVRNITIHNGQINWTNAIITDQVLSIDILKPMKMSLSQGKIYESDTLIVTIISEGKALSDVTVKFAQSKKQTNAQGQTSFTAPNPISNSAVYTVSAEKRGYMTTEKSVTVLKDIYEPFIEFIKPMKGLYFFNVKRIPFPFYNPIILGDVDIIVRGYDKGSGIERVEFYIDGEFKHTSYESPYTYTWSFDTLIQFGFQYKIKAIGYDNANNSNEIDLTAWRLL